MHFAIAAPDASPCAHIQRHIDRKTKPVGALGRLEALARQLALIQHPAEPAIHSPHMLVFAGDHGAARAGVSAYPQDVTWQMVENFLAGGAAINVFCRQVGMTLDVVDAGVAHDFGVRDGLIDAKIAYGTANWLESPAMSCTQLEHALLCGRDIAYTHAGRGANLLGFGEMGIGNTASAALITHCLTDAPLQRVTGRGTGLDDAGLARKLALLERAVARGGRPSDPLQALSEYGGFEIAMMAGAMLGAAERHMILLIDGFIVTAALLAAHRIAPAILTYCVFAHRSEEPGHAVQHAHLGVEPLMSLDLRLGEGTGAALSLPLVRAAVAFYNDMASFETAGVSG
ncbi:nicotinate-nucleotide--dimethylbenzimidazole phosphoribosyltransferase [Rhodocyclaceae bacterium SMB388]